MKNAIIFLNISQNICKSINCRRKEIEARAEKLRIKKRDLIKMFMNGRKRCDQRYRYSFQLSIERESETGRQTSTAFNMYMSIERVLTVLNYFFPR